MLGFNIFIHISAEARTPERAVAFLAVVADADGQQAVGADLDFILGDQRELLVLLPVVEARGGAVAVTAVALVVVELVLAGIDLVFEVQGAGGGMLGAELCQVAHQSRRFRRREAGFDQRIRKAGAERTDLLQCT